MRTIFIDAKAGTVEEFDFTGNFKDIQNKLGVDCFTVVNTPLGTLYVDDNGLINGTEHFFYNRNFYPTPLAGNGLLFGGADREGNDTPCGIDVEKVRASTRFVTLAELRGLCTLMTLTHTSANKGD